MRNRKIGEYIEEEPLEVQALLEARQKFKKKTFVKFGQYYGIVENISHDGTISVRQIELQEISCKTVKDHSLVDYTLEHYKLLPSKYLFEPSYLWDERAIGWLASNCSGNRLELLLVGRDGLVTGIKCPHCK